MKNLFLLKQAIIMTALFLGSLTAPILISGVASAQEIAQNLEKGSCLSFVSADCYAGDDAGQRVDNIIHTAINIFSIVVGIIAVIMIIVGGLKYITSGGESSNVSSAKNTILYAIIGLVIVALAQIIVKFVLSKVSQY